MEKSKKFPLSERGSSLRLRLRNLRKGNLLHKGLKKMRLQRPKRRRRLKRPQLSKPLRRTKGRGKRRRKRLRIRELTLL
jgi:hypothetical protein